MPQQQKTDGFPGIDQEALDKATDQQREFALQLVQGSTACDAYRHAYNAENMKPTTIAVQASELRSHRNVAVWIDAYRLAGLQRGKRTLENHLDRLTELSVKAELTGNYGAAVNAEHHAGKASGLYTEQHVVKTEKPADIAQELADILGIPPETLMNKQGNA